MRAIVVSQGVPGTVQGMNNVRAAHEDARRSLPLMIVSVPHESLSSVSAAADFALMSDDASQADTIAETLNRWGVDVFVHYSFERHLGTSAIAERKVLIESNCEKLGIEYVEAAMPDPLEAGLSAAQEFITENVPFKLSEFAGKKVAFFSTVCGVQAALQSAVLIEKNAYYPQPCCPSPFHGFGESLGLELDYNEPNSALWDIGFALNKAGAVGRFSTYAAPINSALTHTAGRYARTYTCGEIGLEGNIDGTERCDLNELRHILEDFDASFVRHKDYDNIFMVQFEPVDFNDYR